MGEYSLCFFQFNFQCKPKCSLLVPFCFSKTIQFFDKYGYPFELIDVLSQPAKREALAKMTNWPTLPKVFIDGQFYGDTDILDPMAAKGEIEPLLKKAFGK